MMVFYTQRLKKMEEMVTEIEQWCRDLRRESEVQQNVEDDNNPSEVKFLSYFGWKQFTGCDILFV